APYAWYGYIWAMYQRDLVPSGTPNPINTACAINRGEVDYTARALSKWVAHYFETGSMGPSMPRLLRNGEGELVRDSNGLAEGGIRQPLRNVGPERRRERIGLQRDLLGHVEPDLDDARRHGAARWF